MLVDCRRFKPAMLVDCRRAGNRAAAGRLRERRLRATKELEVGRAASHGHSCFLPLPSVWPSSLPGAPILDLTSCGVIP